MGTDLQTVGTSNLTASWQQLLTPRARTVLERARLGERFSAEDIRAVAPIAQATPPAVIPADDRFVRQSLAGLASALPAKATDELTGKLKLATYHTMLRGYPEGAFVWAMRRCLDELQWFPTIRELKERLDRFVSDEQRAINRARFVMRNPMPDAEPDLEPMTGEELARLARTEIGRTCLDLGLAAGHISQADFDAAMATQEGIEA